MQETLYKKIFKHYKTPLLIIEDNKVIDFNNPYSDLFNAHTLKEINQSKFINNIIDEFNLNENQNFNLKYNLLSYSISFNSISNDDSLYLVEIDFQPEIHNKALLYDKNKFLDQLFNRSIFPIAILDTHEVVLDVNNIFEKIFKYTRDEAIGKSINDLIVPNELSEESEKFKSTVFKEKTLNRKTIRYDKYGNKIDVEAVGSPIIMNNKVVGIFAMYNDIREEAKALNELKKQQIYFKELFNKSPDAIALLNSSNKIVTINETFEKYFEYHIDELYGKNIDDYIVPKNHLIKAEGYSNNVMNNKSSINVESVRISKNNKKRHVEISAYPISMDENKLGVYAIYRDISSRKEKEKRIHDMAYMDNLTKTYNRRKFYPIV